jgi:hypothetical protein
VQANKEGAVYLPERMRFKQEAGKYQHRATSMLQRGWMEREVRLEKRERDGRILIGKHSWAGDVAVVEHVADAPSQFEPRAGARDDATGHNFSATPLLPLTSLPSLLPPRVACRCLRQAMYNVTRRES